jgi:hypothetical protein
MSVACSRRRRGLRARRHRRARGLRAASASPARRNWAAWASGRGRRRAADVVDEGAPGRWQGRWRETTGELSPSSGAPRQSTRRRPRQAPNARWRCHGMTGKVATCQRGNPRRKGENEMPRPEWCRATVSRTPCRSAFGCEHTNVVVVPNTPRAARYVRMPLPVAAHEKKARWREAHESISH